jgi:hypothetical protein
MEPLTDDEFKAFATRAAPYHIAYMQLRLVETVWARMTERDEAIKARDTWKAVALERREQGARLARAEAVCEAAIEVLKEHPVALYSLDRALHAWSSSRDGKGEGE